jgi:glycosyltransferase involved in cell wall biosynthesis
MHIWLATVGEPLPMDGKDVRLLRTAQFAEWLAGQGHEVVFWTGTMDHYRRRLRSKTRLTTEISTNYRIVQLEGRLYKRSISFNRFMNHVDVGRAFSRHSGEFEEPDVILASFPTEELCRHMLDYAEPRRIPVIVDVRDLWPDIFSDALPAFMRFIAPLLFLPLERRAARILRRATAVSGPANSMIQWGLDKAQREARPEDFWFPFTYPSADVPADAADLPGPFRELGADERAWFCFFGAISARYNLEMVVDCFKMLDSASVKASMVICGVGDAAEALKQRAGEARNIHFPGWMNLGQIRAIMQRSQAGIFPYNTIDYFNNLPNKVCEYLAGGLPIVSCTRGEVKALVERTGCGFWHEPDAESMQQTVLKLVAQPQLLADAARKARHVHATEFEREAVFSRTLAKLQAIAARHQGAAKAPYSRLKKSPND